MKLTKTSSIFYSLQKKILNCIMNDHLITIKYHEKKIFICDSKFLIFFSISFNKFFVH